MDDNEDEDARYEFQTELIKEISDLVNKRIAEKKLTPKQDDAVRVYLTETVRFW